MEEKSGHHLVAYPQGNVDVMMVEYGIILKMITVEIHLIAVNTFH